MTAQADLLARARVMADRGVQKADGYDYVVSSERIAETNDLLRELADALEARA